MRGTHAQLRVGYAGVAFLSTGAWLGLLALTYCLRLCSTARPPQSLCEWRLSIVDTLPGGEMDLQQSLVALLKNEWVPMSSADPLCPGGRTAVPTPSPAPRRGSPRRRTGSGAGAVRPCLPQALERGGEIVRVKGSLRRAPPALDPANLTLSRAPHTHSKFKRGSLVVSRP